jgi:uncharacterized protein YjbJ (UPF0337 family)
MTISNSGLEIETKGKIEQSEGRVRGYLVNAPADTSEHRKGWAEEAKALIQKDFGQTERKV